jgi:hypothetical protein
MQTVTVWNDRCEWREVEYTIEGRYSPATFDHEAEYPEIIVHSVTCCDEDGNPAELPADEWESIDAMAWEAINE